MGMSEQRCRVPTVAVLSVGRKWGDWPALSETGQFHWHVIEATAVTRQIRQIWISEAVAVVVFVGPDEAVDRAMELLRLLRETGPPIVVAIAHPHDEGTELRIRQTGAIYLCGPTAHLRLTDLLRQTLCGIDTV